MCLDSTTLNLRNSLVLAIRHYLLCALRKLGFGSIDLAECTAYGGANVDPKSQVNEVCTTEPSLITTAEAIEEDHSYEEDHIYESVDMPHDYESIEDFSRNPLTYTCGGT